MGVFFLVDSRKAESAAIRAKYPERVPVSTHLTSIVRAPQSVFLVVGIARAMGCEKRFGPVFEPEC